MGIVWSTVLDRNVYGFPSLVEILIAHQGSVATLGVASAAPPAGIKTRSPDHVRSQAPLRIDNRESRVPAFQGESILGLELLGVSHHPASAKTSRATVLPASGTAFRMTESADFPVIPSPQLHS